MKRVLQIGHGYNPPFLDVANHFAQVFQAMEGEVDTLYLSGETSSEVEDRTRASRVFFWELGPPQLRGLKFKYIARLYRMVKKERYDVLVCHRYKAIFLACFAQWLYPHFTVIGVMHNFGYFRRLPQKLFLSLFKRRLYLLAVSDALRDDIREAADNFPAERVQTLYNGIDYQAVRTRQLGREAARDALGLPPEGFIFVNTGRLHPDKDQATLIKGFAAFRQAGHDAKLAIMGSGRLEKALKELSAQLGVGDAVIFLGQVKDGARYFKAFDAFVLTSAREPFGLVLLEAMAAGLPIAAADSGGAPEVVGDAGYIFKQGDASHLGLKLMQLYELTDAERKDLRQKMDARVDANFTPEACCRQLAAYGFFDSLNSVPAN